ncbi:MAG: hypothetical protein FRX49_11106 [Trebouxia sp. A1-2]|nr:MAG: hypothetical protein FRX49_11106 [Trebouxia sp. A1-2]
MYGDHTGTGVAYVQFVSSEAAEQAQNTKHKQMMGTRYIECMILIPGRHMPTPFGTRPLVDGPSAPGPAALQRGPNQAGMPHDSSAAGHMPTGRGPPLSDSRQPSPGLQPSGLGKPRSCPAGHAPSKLQQLQQQQQLMAQQQYALQQEQMMMQQQHWGGQLRGWWSHPPALSQGGMKPYLMGMASGGPWQVPSMPLGTELPGTVGMGVAAKGMAYAYPAGPGYGWAAVHASSSTSSGPPHAVLAPFSISCAVLSLPFCTACLCGAGLCCHAL